MPNHCSTVLYRADSTECIAVNVTEGGDSNQCFEVVFDPAYLVTCLALLKPCDRNNYQSETCQSPRLGRGIL